MTIAMVMALFGSCCCIKRKKVEEELERPHDVEADAYPRETKEGTPEGSHDAEKLHDDQVEPAPKKGFSFPWGKKKNVETEEGRI
jgi:hypothetical protein